MQYLVYICFSLATAKKHHITQVCSKPWASGPQTVLDVGQVPPEMDIVLPGG